MFQEPRIVIYHMETKKEKESRFFNYIESVNPKTRAITCAALLSYLSYCLFSFRRIFWKKLLRRIMDKPLRNSTGIGFERNGNGV